MTKPCTQCNQPNPADAMYCLNCASPLRQNAAPPVIGNANPGQQWTGGGQGGVMSAPVRQAGGDFGQKAVAALILAVAALFCCGPITGVPAAIVGWMELDAIKNGRSPAGGRWMALVGLWGGIAMSILHVVGYIFWILLSAMSAASNPYGY